MRRSSFSPMIPIMTLVLAGCSGLSDVKSNNSSGGGAGGTQNAAVTILPTSATVAPFAAQAFTATVTGSSNSSVTWQVNGVTGGSQTTGAISSSGLFSAPHSVNPSLIPSNGAPVTVTVTAISTANSTAVATAIVTINTQQQASQTGAIKLGTSGGNINDISGPNCCSGTLGSLVTWAGSQYILSNNHVMAKSDGGIIGDAINQPGLIDAPSPCVTTGTTTVASLSAFFNLQTGPTPIIDAALAQVVAGQVDTGGNILLLGATVTNGIPDPGAPNAGTGVAAAPGQSVAKSGRTTGLTCSTVLATSVEASVDYYKNCGDTTPEFTVNYTDLVSVAGGTFSDSGDSGSLIVTQTTTDPVALLFAGSDTDSVGNPVGDVLPAFVGTGNATPTFVGGTAHQVIGCTLPSTTQSAVLPRVTVSTEAAQTAALVRDLLAPRLLANAGIHAIGLGTSYDDPGQATILLFVNRNAPQTAIPRSLDGVRTSVILGDNWTYRGLLNTAETTQMMQGVAPVQMAYALKTGEMERAKSVWTKHKDELLKNPNVLGVGISSSLDSPGDAALLVYVKSGVAHDFVPAEIDGLRTRIRDTGKFTAGRNSNGPSVSGCKAHSVLTGETTSGKL